MKDFGCDVILRFLVITGISKVVIFIIITIIVIFIFILLIIVIIIAIIILWSTASRSVWLVICISMMLGYLIKSLQWLRGYASQSFTTTSYIIAHTSLSSNWIKNYNSFVGLSKLVFINILLILILIIDSLLRHQ